MQQLLNVWSGLDSRRQIILVVSTLAVFFGILAMSRMATAPSMTLLYSGLENGAAGEVVRSLEQRGVPFEVRGGAIFVPSSERDQLRMTLASEGLPANSSRGYELLDGLSGFGTTSQMFDAAYWRAKEGELARTIVSNSYVASARVHIATTGSNPFQRGVTPKASVAITPSGASITTQQAKAIRFLVASAVAGLAPEDVAVIDANGALIATTEEAPAVGDDDRAGAMRERVERLLEARVGFGNAVVEVSVETVNESEEIRERRFDPEGRVAISTDTEERSSNSNEAGGDDVTVASNLPDEQGGEAGTSSSQDTETRERINYEVSETEVAIVRAPGAIKRLTVAVLVNDETIIDANGQEISQPRQAEELQSLRELVESAVGFDADRGDVITIKSMSLQSVPLSGTEVTTSIIDYADIDVMSAIQMAVLAVVTLILGLFVIRPLLSRAPAQIAAPASSNAGNLPAAPLADGVPDFEELTGGGGDAGLPDIQINNEMGDLPDLPGLPDFSAGGMADFGSPDAGDNPVDRLRAMIGDRQEETVEVLRSWLEDDQKERAS